jgi:CelD/BcsL family acetyltransferase involved in cellulose biosynthesis
VLCAPGAEVEAAAAVRGAIASLRPRPDLIAFEAVPASSPWTRLLASGSGRARLARYRNSTLPAPVVTFPREGGFEAWMASRSGNFRSQMRRMGRRLESRGGGVRMLHEPGEVRDGIAAMLELHRGRWSGRGESGLARAGVPALLADAAGSLGPDRLRLWVAEVEGEPISIQLFIAAGEEIKYWNGGWSEEHADLKPSMLTILAAIEDAIERGERRLDLGVGTHDYKLRFSDSEDTLSWGGLIARNRRWPATRAELAPRVLRYRAKLAVQALPEPVTERVAAAVRARRGD